MVQYFSMTSRNPDPIFPPGLISALTNGFNTVANHVYLILFPVVFDLLLWIGPHFRMHTIIQPFFTDLSASTAQLGNAELNEMMKISLEMWNLLLERFNLISTLRTYPIGVPSLLTMIAPLRSPLGDAPIYEMSSFAGVIALWVGLALLGLFLGTLFFSQISSCTSGEKENLTLEVIAQQTLNIFLLTLTLIVLILFLSVPAFVLLAVLGLLSPILAQVAFFILVLFVLWLLLPLFFSPHGIFLFKLNALSSILTSARTVRVTLPATSLFLLILLVIGQGLNLIWRMPPETSWMMLIGILGHAFISTGLIASSFIYYQRDVEWIQAIIKQRTDNEPKI